MAHQELSLEQLQAMQGEALGTSAWHRVDQHRINTFADATEDWQFIHIDPERAADETAFGGTIAHGFLTLSLLPVMAAEALPPLAGLRVFINYGLNKMRFLAPVNSGTRVRGHFRLLGIIPKGDNRVLLRYGVEIEIEQQEKPALIAEWLGMAVC